MTSAVAMISPKFYGFDPETGNPLAFGKVYTYAAGTNTPKATYASEDAAVANPNPVILNAAGYANIYLQGSYKIVVKDADDVKVWTADPVSDASSLLQPWIQEAAATQVAPNQFKVTGNQTDIFRYGRSVKLDDKVIFYGTVTGSSYTSGETTVTIDAVDSITSELTRVWASLVDLESLLPAVLRSDLVQPVATFDNVAQMKASTRLDVGRKVRTLGYYSPGDGGGNDYEIEAAGTGTDDGGSFIDLSGSGLQAKGLFTTVKVTPLSFGAVNSPTVDSSEAITSFFQYAASTPIGRYTFEFSGDYGTSQTLTLSGFKYKRMTMDAYVKALSPLNVVFKFDRCNNSVFPGQLRVDGTGDSSLLSNTCMDAIQIISCRLSEFGVLHARYGQRWGVYDTDGNNNMVRIQQIVANDFGASNSSDRVQSINVVSFSKTGGSNSGTQRSVLTVSNPENFPPSLDSYVVVAGFPFAVQSMDVASSTIEVFPWIPTSDEVPGYYGVVYGGGTSIGGPDGAKIEIGSITPTRCGIGALLTSTSAPNVGRFVGQFNGVSLALGDLRGSRTFSGVDISSVYFEGESVAEIMFNSTTGTYSNGSSLTCVTSADPSKWFYLDPRVTGGGFNNRRYFPVEILVGNVRWPAQSSRDIATGSNTDSSRYYLSPLGNNTFPLHVQAYRNGVTLKLIDDKDFRRLKGLFPVSALVTGGGPNGNYDDTLYVEAEDGYTINGMVSPIRLASNPNPMRITAWLTSETNWRIAVEELPPPTLFV